MQTIVYRFSLLNGVNVLLQGKNFPLLAIFIAIINYHDI